MQAQITTKGAVSTTIDALTTISIDELRGALTLKADQLGFVPAVFDYTGKPIIELRGNDEGFLTVVLATVSADDTKGILHVPFSDGMFPDIPSAVESAIADYCQHVVMATSGASLCLVCGYETS